jgi:ABC-type Mn2+/Zn2+ transport system ATPase subunit
VTTIVNGGSRFQATFMNRVVSSDYSKVIATGQPTIANTIELSDGAIDAVFEGMIKCANESGGTAYKTFGNYPVKVAAKTVTSLQTSEEQDVVKETKKRTSKRKEAKANQELSNQTKELNFKLIDSEMNDIRPTTNLSGGETFLVSLALALGLASMASRNIRIDTLYIDEGFGTLDNDTLSRTLQALCEINEQGRQIGIISHIEALQETITTKIVVSKNGHGGYSTLSGPGIVCHKPA